MRRRIAAVVIAAIVLTGPFFAMPAAAATAPPGPVPEDPTDPIRAGEYWLDQYGIRDAWNTTRGAGVKIAIIDTGIGKTPPAFAGVVAGTDVSGVGGADGRSPIGGVDANHGSWVASLAAARATPDGRGVVGVAPEAELLAISVGFGQTTDKPFTEQIAEAVRWAVDNGADVINMSLTTNTPDWPESWDQAFQYAYDKDVVIVVAAGNRGSGTTRVGAPATIPGVLVVGGVDRSGFASVEASTQGITIGVAAASEQLLGVSADGSLVQWSGTSGAAPIVSGVAALVRAAHPELDANNVLNRIVATATTAPGGDDPLLYGAGIVNAAAAVSANVGLVDKNPMGSLEEWVRLYRRAEAAPAPTPTVGPVDIPALPQPDQPTAAVSPLLPSPETVLYGTVPLIAVTSAAILVGLGFTAAVRLSRSARGPRVPRRPST